MKGLIFTYLMTYGGAVTAVFRPQVGLLIYICFAIIKPESLWHWSVPAGNYSRIIALAMLLGWTLQGFGNWRFGRAHGIVAALLGYMGWVIVCAAAAPNQDVAWKFVENTAKIVLPFLVGITTIDSVQKLKQLAWVIVVSQGYVAYEMNSSYYNGFNRIEQVGFGGMDNNSAAIAMVTCVGLAFFLGLQSAKSWQKALALGFAMLMAHAVMLTFSRGGMLALIITTVATFLLVPKEPKHYAIFLVALLLGLRLAGAEVVERFSSSFVDAEERDGSAESRVQLWSACWDAMLKNPAVGLGPNHWRQVAHTYGFTPGKSAHSTWMETGANLGFPGFIGLISFYVICLARLRPLMSSAEPVPDPWLHDVARMVISSIVGFAVAAQFVSLYGLEVPYYVVLLGAGALKLASEPSAMMAADPWSDQATELLTPGPGRAWPETLASPIR